MSLNESTINIPILDNIDKTFIKGERIFAVATFCIMLIIMIIQVIARYFLELPTPWAEEIIRFLFVMTTYISAAVLTQERDHIAIDVIATSLEDIKDTIKREKTNYFLWLFADIISFILTCFVTYHVHIYTMTMMRTSQESPALQWPMAPVIMFMEIGFILMSIHYLIKIINSFNTMNYKRRESKK
ncbi:MAG TPA: TRAP transporter small permease [Clostridia bacterium]|nr:TRAP transporter small permease [Clostridia bacterium]